MGGCKSKDASAAVQKAWDNHFSSFGSQDIDKIMLDYSSESIITIVDQNSQTKTEYKGLEGVRKCFEELFSTLSDISDLEAPVQLVKEARKHELGNVFLTWRCPASGYTEATDTFIFDASSRIVRQNVVINFKDPKGDGSVVAKNDRENPTGEGKVHEGWGHHVKAFDEQNLDDLLNDYAPEAEITVVNTAIGSMTKFTGPGEVRSYYEGLFAALPDRSGLDTPIQHVEEPTEAAAGQVFDVWNCPASHFHRATDTFTFNSEGKITSQNVVVYHTPPVVQAAWDNHFAAFGAQDVEKILQDYSEQSVITVYEQSTGSRTVYSGLDGVRTCFDGLFKSLFDTSNLDAPVQVVKEASLVEPGSVFLIWNCLASGYSQATDTFIFDSAGKIFRQNVVVVYQDPKAEGSAEAKNDSVAPSGSGPVHEGWDNHFKAFGEKNVENILKDYIEASEITVFNQVDKTSTKYQGLDGAKACFEGLFQSLHDCSNLAAPIIHVEEAAGGNAGQVFLCWSCSASGYERATDTFIFNSAGKITRQHVVVHHTPIANI
jgi:hypothetical protein